MFPRKFTVQLLACFHVRVSRIFATVKSAEVMNLFTQHDRRFPFVGALIPRHAFKTRSVSFGFPFVALILRCRRLPKIAPSIVQRIAIYVVNLVRGPSTGYVRPYDSIIIKNTVIKTDHSAYGPVRAGRKAPSNFTDWSTLSFFYPSQFASFRIVRKVLTQYCGIRKMFFSHGAVTSLFGKRLAATTNRCEPRHYTMAMGAI